MIAFRNHFIALALVIGTAAAADTDELREHSVRETAPNALPPAASTEYRLPAFHANNAIRKDRDSARQKASAQSNDAYFFSVDLFLDGDFDGDGHFYVLDLSWDADTIFQLLDVYAVVWLSFEGGPWEEFLTTDVYTLSGNSSADIYQVETELQRGYPTGYYDILIELYDAATGDFLAEIGPVDSATLDEIPLEDAGRDAFFVADHHGGGGSLGIYSIMGFATLGYHRRRRRHRHRAAKL